MINFYIDKDTETLILLQELLDQQEKDYHMSKFSGWVPLEETLKRLDHYTNKPMLEIVLLDIAHSDTAVWRAELKQTIEDHNTDSPSEESLQHFGTISTILTTRRMIIEMYQYKETYVAFVSRAPKDDEANMFKYRLILASMMLSRTDDQNFIDRASTALVTDTYLRFTSEEVTLLNEHLAERRQKRLRQALINIVTESRPTREIESTQENIRDLTHRINALEQHLKQLTLKDYAIAHSLVSAETNVDEVMEYLSSIQDSLLDLQVPESSMDRMHITLASYMRLSDEDLDFVKDEAIAHSEHPLYGKPGITKLLKAAIAQEIRIPIAAWYGVEKDSANIYVRGGELLPEHRGHYADNKHITYYDCFDGYKRQAVQALVSQDLISFFEILRQCTGTVNLFEYPTNSRIIDTIEALRTDSVLQVKVNNRWEAMTLAEYIQSKEEEEQHEDD